MVVGGPHVSPDGSESMMSRREVGAMMSINMCGCECECDCLEKARFGEKPLNLSAKILVGQSRPLPLDRRVQLLPTSLPSPSLGIAP